ncbi:RimJ/RimL family protein N-acetyltransferase [Lysinibacillus composti]|uniref:N-acetyltransferase n=1 Tax=Lysinibacillus composti TaxID=720633 RepID=A0A3N9UBI8_9BACI|nr:GNAT family protein [Lysinibacillus composti]MBM7610255.1 RimJ/RimL family protein N-acetyltransferase [Lysinibacillus composti]RQW73824.1 N-acetyltransferase [Lysinibacillus composti]
MIIGNNIIMKLMEDKDIQYKVKWVNDEEIRDVLISDFISESQTRQWLSKNAHNNTRRDFFIFLKEDEKPIGFSSLKNIDYINSKAEMTLCIGDKEVRGRGLAKEARGLMLDYAFLELGLNKLYTHNWVKNKPIINLNQKMGFKIEGTLRQNKFFKGEFRDFVVMGLLKSEWVEQKIPK